MVPADFETHEYDVIVIGAGGAELRAAAEAATHGDTLAPDGGGVDLGDERRAARNDPRVVGGALYRSHDDPGTVVLFLGLAWGVTPSGIGFSVARLGRASIAGTLSLAFDLCRLACEALPATPGDACVHVPGWMRHGVATRALRAYVASPHVEDCRHGLSAPSRSATTSPTRPRQC